MDEAATLTTTFLPGPILECLLDYLPIGSLRNLQLTCRHFAALYSYALSTRWKIDQHLKRFLPHPKSFRRMLDDCNAIISGSVALRFFDHNSTWEPGDMDFYIPALAIWRMHWHLIKDQECTYTDVRTAEQAQYPAEDITEVRTYSRLSEETRQIERIQMVGISARYKSEQDYRRSGNMAQMSILHGFHATAVLNYLSGTEAVSLYPQTTFVKRRMYMINQYGGQRARAVQKYVDRGWALHDLGFSEQRRTSHPMRKARYVGDRLCWRIRYGEEGKARSVHSRETPLKKQWWTMEDHCQWLLHELPAPGPAGAEDDKILRWSTRTHCYSINFRGAMRADTVSIYRSLAMSSPSHSIHLPDARQEDFFCTCLEQHTYANGPDLPARWKCEVGQMGVALPQGAAAPSVERYTWHKRPWSATSVGFCAPVEAMIAMAENLDEDSKGQFQVSG